MKKPQFPAPSMWRRVRPVVALGLMAPALLLSARQANAFEYDTDIPGVTQGIPTASQSYALTDDSAGSATVTFPKTNSEIQAIINNAAVGSTIRFAAGTYNVGNISIDKKLTLRAAQNATVWFDGAISVGGWQRETGTNRWFVSSTNFEFLANSNAGNIDSGLNARADDGEMVFRGGKPQVQRNARTDIDADGEFYVDRSAHKLYVYSGLSGGPINIEITRYNSALELNAGAGQTTLRGLNFRRYAGRGTDPGGTVGAAVISNVGDTIIDRCCFFWNAHAGLLNKNADSLITRSNFVANSANGLITGRSGTKVSGNTISWNNAEGFKESWSISGIKCIGLDNGHIYDNFFEGNKGKAVWLDSVSINSKIFRNYIKGGAVYNNTSNPGGGIEIEQSESNTVALNLITGCGAGLNLASAASTRVFNNTFYDNNQHLYLYDRQRFDGGDDGTRFRVKNTAMANNILLSGGNYSVEAFVQDIGAPSAARFSTLNYNVYRTSGALFRWKPASGAVISYSSLGTFRTDTGFESNGITKGDDVFASVASRDFRISGDDASMATQGLTVPSDIRALMNDSLTFPVVDDALTNPRCDLIAAGALGAPDVTSTSTTSIQKHRGAVRPTAPTAQRTMQSAPLSPSGSNS